MYTYILYIDFLYMINCIASYLSSFTCIEDLRAVLWEPEGLPEI